MSGVVIQGSGQANITVTGNTVRTGEYAVDVQAAMQGLTISGNTVTGRLVFINNVSVAGVVSGNSTTGGGFGAVVQFDGECPVAIRGNHFYRTNSTTIWLLATTSGGPEGVEISDNTIHHPASTVTTNTQDGIRVDAGQAFIHGNKITPRTSAPLTRYGVNLAADSFCCKVVGNDFGDPADYGTNAYVDNGTDNTNEWPADPTYGDNFTECPPGSA